MKIDIIDVDEFVNINDLKEVTSPVIFQRGGIPDPDGLLSTRIFGSTISERRETFAYIDLGGEFFHPAVYRALYAVFRNIDRIIDGTKFYKIDKDGHLIEDEGGESGIEFLYNNWKKINWGEKEVGSGKIRNERLDLINKTPKNLVFINKYPVLPVFYRDVKSDGAGSGGSTNELNNLYTTLIRHASSVRDKGMFDFTFHASHMQIQRAINDIYEYFKHKIERKNGLIRKYLMGKSVINSARSVITPTVYNAKSPSELLVNYEYSGVPIAQCCGLEPGNFLHLVQDLHIYDKHLIENKEKIEKWLKEKNDNFEPVILKISEKINNPERNLKKAWELFENFKLEDYILENYNPKNIKLKLEIAI